MSDLLEAFQIFLKYGNPEYPTMCEHDEMMVCIDPEMVSEEDKLRLENLSFRPSGEVFKSYRFGSA